MRSLGGFMVLMGAGSFLLNLAGREFILLMWIDTWGPTVGLILRLALIVVGAGLWFVGGRREVAED